MHLKLHRYPLPGGQSIPGILEARDKKFCTLEQPWRDNKRFVSCVPEGRYILLPFDSLKYGKTWCMVAEDLEVFKEDKGHGRFACLLHWGNWVRNTQGCVLVGTTHGCLISEYAVRRSKPAFKELNTFLYESGDAHQLTIARGL